MRTLGIALVPALVLAAGSSVAMGQGRLIAIDSARVLYEIDRTTGTKTQIGTASGGATTGGLAYDAASQILYLTSTSLDSLFTLNLDTFEATLVGAYNQDVVMHGLEWNSSNNTLYGGSNGNIYTIDTATGNASLLSNTGITSFANLGYDSTNNVMYMTSSSTDSSYTLDLDFGIATLLGPLNGPTNPNGLAYVPEDDALYLVCNSTDTLYTLDRTTGAAVAIGSTGSGNLLGLVWIPEGGGSVCPSCAADYDQDGGVTGGDLAAFFADFEAGAACADVDQDGGVTGGDLAFFFAAYEAGGC
jgi:hypothetical protein